MKKNKLNKYSKTITQDESQAGSQAMLYGIGLSDSDMKKAQVELLPVDMKETHVICI